MERYQGPWSDKSKLWSESLKKEAGYEGDSDDGIWFITAQDYANSFVKTTYTPDVSKEFLDYHAFFDVDTSAGPVTETVRIRTEIDQEVFISGYTYDSQHLRNGECLAKTND